MNKDSRVLVTGHRGLVGSALAKLLTERGYDVYDTGSFDLTERDQTATAFGTIRPTHIFHCAGKVAGIGGNLNTPAHIFSDNIRINTNVVEMSRVYGAEKILCMSSGSVYRVSDFPLAEESIWSGPPHESEAAYAHAKRAMLAHLQAEEQQFDIDFVYVISCNLYGPGDRFNVDYGHVIPSLVAKFHEAKLAGMQPTVWGDGSAVRDFLYVDDVVNALITLMLKSNGVVNMGSGNGIAIKTIVRHLEALYALTPVWDLTKPNGQATRLYDLGRLNLAWPGPKIDIAEGLKRTVDWYGENYDRARR